MASEQPPVYDQDEQLEPMEEPTADLDAAWQDSISDRGIQIPFFVSQSVAGQWKDRWGDSPEAFYYRVPLLDLMQRVEALCQKIIKHLATKANGRLIACTQNSHVSSLRTSFSEGRTLADSEHEITSNRISVGSSISSASETALFADDNLSSVSMKPMISSKHPTVRKSKFSEATLLDPLESVAETIMEMRPGVALIESQVNEFAAQIEAYLTIMEQTRKQFASLQFNLSKKQQAGQTSSTSLVRKSLTPLPPTACSVQSLAQLASSIDPASANSAENAQLVLKKLAGIAQECASKLKDCSTALNLAVSQCKTANPTVHATHNHNHNHHHHHPHHSSGPGSLVTSKSKKSLDPIAEAAITSQIAQAKQTVDMLSDALWAEGTEVGMERLEREAEKAVRELDERIERASRGLASLGGAANVGSVIGGGGRKARRKAKR